MSSRVSPYRARALDGLAAALGMGLGGVVFSALALAGLTALLSQFEWLYLALKVAGGGYLAYIAFKIWRSARGASRRRRANDRQPRARTELYDRASDATQQSEDHCRLRKHLCGAAAKTIPLGLVVALPVGVFFIEAGWYAIVALAFSSRHPA